MYTACCGNCAAESYLLMPHIDKIICQHVSAEVVIGNYGVNIKMIIIKVNKNHWNINMTQHFNISAFYLSDYNKSVNFIFSNHFRHNTFSFIFCGNTLINGIDIKCRQLV